MSTSSTLAGGRVPVRAIGGFPRVSRLGAGLCAKMGEGLRLRGVGAEAVCFRVSSTFRPKNHKPPYPEPSDRKPTETPCACVLKRQDPERFVMLDN